MVESLRLSRRSVLAGLVGSFPALARSQGSSYPSKPIHLVVVFPPGGGTDAAARLVAPQLAQRLGQPIIVENKPGQGGGIGLDYVAKSAPDGYTLVLASSGGLTALPSLYRKLPFNPEKDFVPISTFGISPLVLVAAPNFEASNVKDIVALARKQPGKLAYGSGGNGTAPHLSGELFKSMTGTDILHVPYKGSGPALVAVMSGEIPLTFSDMSTARPLILAGKVKAIAVLGKSRTSVAPQIPTMAEAGLPGYESEGWFGILAPAGTPQAIADRLSTELGAILSSPEVKAQFATAALEPTHCKPAELAQLIKRDSAKWSKIIVDNRISAN
jgi:tripartite-type tricarboxylate transporter receptor subunit TctC